MYVIKFLSNHYVHTISGMIELTDNIHPFFTLAKVDYEKIIDPSKMKVDYTEKLLIGISGPNTIEAFLRSVTPIEVETRPQYNLYRYRDVFFYKLGYTTILIYDDIQEVRNSIVHIASSTRKFHMENITHIEKFQRINKKFDALYDLYVANKYVEMPPELDRIYSEFFDRGKLTRDSIETLNILAAGMTGIKESVASGDPQTVVTSVGTYTQI